MPTDLTARDPLIPRPTLPFSPRGPRYIRPTYMAKRPALPAHTIRRPGASPPRDGRRRTPARAECKGLWKAFSGVPSEGWMIWEDRAAARVMWCGGYIEVESEVGWRTAGGAVGVNSMALTQVVQDFHPRMETVECRRSMAGPKGTNGGSPGQQRVVAGRPPVGPGGIQWVGRRSSMGGARYTNGWSLGNQWQGARPSMVGTEDSICWGPGKKWVCNRKLVAWARGNGWWGPGHQWLWDREQKAEVQENKCLWPKEAMVGVH